MKPWGTHPEHREHCPCKRTQEAEPDSWHTHPGKARDPPSGRFLSPARKDRLNCDETEFRLQQLCIKTQLDYFYLIMSTYLEIQTLRVLGMIARGVPPTVAPVSETSNIDTLHYVLQ
eukprot:gene12131-biopygen3316